MFYQAMHTQSAVGTTYKIMVVQGVLALSVEGMAHLYLG